MSKFFNTHAMGLLRMHLYNVKKLKMFWRISGPRALFRSISNPGGQTSDFTNFNDKSKKSEFTVAKENFIFPLLGMFYVLLVDFEDKSDVHLCQAYNDR